MLKAMCALPRTRCPSACCCCSCPRRVALHQLPVLMAKPANRIVLGGRGWGWMGGPLNSLRLLYSHPCSRLAKLPWPQVAIKPGGVRKACLPPPACLHSKPAAFTTFPSPPLQCPHLLNLPDLPKGLHCLASATNPAFLPPTNAGVW